MPQSQSAQKQGGVNADYVFVAPLTIFTEREPAGDVLLRTERDTENMMVSAKMVSGPHKKLKD